MGLRINLRSLDLHFSAASSSNSRLLNQEMKPISEGELQQVMEPSPLRMALLSSICHLQPGAQLPSLLLPSDLGNSSSGSAGKEKSRSHQKSLLGFGPLRSSFPCSQSPKSLLQPLIFDSELPPPPDEQCQEQTPPLPGSFLSQTQQSHTSSFLSVTKSKTSPTDSKTW